MKDRINVAHDRHRVSTMHERRSRGHGWKKYLRCCRGQNLMASRLGKEREHCGEDQSTHEKHTDANCIGGSVPTNGCQVVKSVYGDNEKCEDKYGNKYVNCKVDTAACKVTDIPIVCLPSGILGNVSLPWGCQSDDQSYFRDEETLLRHPMLAMVPRKLIRRMLTSIGIHRSHRSMFSTAVSSQACSRPLLSVTRSSL